MTDYSLTHEERTKITTEMLCDWINNTERLLNVIREIVEESKRLPMVEDIDRMWHKRLRELLRTACAQMTKAGPTCGTAFPEKPLMDALVEALQNYHAIFDTPVGRRQHNTDFDNEARKIARAALERY